MTHAAPRPAIAVPATLPAYLQRIRRFELLTPEQEIALGRKVQAGREATVMLASPGAPSEEAVRRLAQLAALNRSGVPPMESSVRCRQSILIAVEQEGHRARRHMIEANLRLVFQVARRYSVRLDLPILELVQEGNIGLIRAVDGFDPDRGCRFSTYAVWWIRQSIGLAVRRHLAAAGRTDGSGARTSQFATNSFVSALDPVGDATDVICASMHPIAKDDPEDLALAALARRDVRAAVASLTSVERTVIETRYGLRDHRMRNRIETGLLLGLTYARVRRIEARALAKLREPDPGPSLAGYLA